MDGIPMKQASSIDAAMAIDFRRAVVSDAQALAEMFAQTYGETSHPLRDPQRIHELVNRSENICLLGLHRTRIVACVGITHYPWNDSFELGRAITVPEFRGQGLAVQLVQKCLDWLREVFQPAVFWGTPRVARIYDICCHDVSPQMIATGHDGGSNYAHGKPETHLLIFGSTQDPGPGHVRPLWKSRERSDCVEQRIWRPLGWSSQPGRYPAEFLTGPRNSDAKRHKNLVYRFDSTCPSRALELLDFESSAPSETTFLSQLQSLLKLCSAARHVSFSLLADKIDLLERLVEIGFVVTAYMPGWHLATGRRYDCLRMVLHLIPENALGNGMEPIIASLDLELADWFRASYRPLSLC